MFKAIKEFFLGKPVEVQTPYKVEAPTVEPVKEEVKTVVEETKPVVEQVQPVVEAKVDPVSVALDLEPVDFAATTTPVTAKKPRKPRAPKVVAEKPAAKKAAPVKKAAVKKPAAPKKPATPKSKKA
jgi:hypothetical protein